MFGVARPKLPLCVEKCNRDQPPIELSVRKMNLLKFLTNARLSSKHNKQESIPVVRCSDRCGGGGGYLPRGVCTCRRVYLPKGCVPARGFVPARGVCTCWGGGGCSCPGGCLPGGGVYPSLYWGRPLPLWTEFLTHACENITLLQLRCGR